MSKMTVNEQPIKFNAVMDNPWETKKESKPASAEMEESLAELETHGSTHSYQEPYQNLLSKGNSQANSQEFFSYESYSANYGTGESSNQRLQLQKSTSVATDPWNPAKHLSVPSTATDFSKVEVQNDPHIEHLAPIDYIKITTLNERKLFSHVVYEISSQVHVINLETFFHCTQEIF